MKKRIYFVLPFDVDDVGLAPYDLEELVYYMPGIIHAVIGEDPRMYESDVDLSVTEFLNAGDIGVVASVDKYLRDMYNVTQKCIKRESPKCLKDKLKTTTVIGVEFIGKYKLLLELERD